MKKLTKFYGFLLFVIAVVFSTAMKPAPKKIIFFGDSITEQGVGKSGYVTLISNALNASNYQVIGAGVSGNKIYDLYLRLEDDVLSKKPDLVFIYVGINDVWHKQLLRTGTDYDKYLKFYQALINKIQASGSKVILCTPTVIGEKKNGTNEMDADLDKYAEGIRKLAAQNSLPLCDLRKAFIDFEVAGNSEDKEKGLLTTDRVHLTDAGNKLVADKMLELIK